MTHPNQVPPIGVLITVTFFGVLAVLTVLGLLLVVRRPGNVPARSWLLGLGLPAATVWSVAVSASMPSWFDPSEDCALTAQRSADGYGSSAGIDVETSWFPPRATCDFGDGEVYQFISPARTVTFTVAGIVIALAVGAGLVLAGRTLFAPVTLLRSADAVGLRRRGIGHAAVAVITGWLAGLVAVTGIVAAIFLGGPPGLITVAITAVVLLSWIASTIDRHHGPLPATDVQSRRRGVAAAVIVLAAIGITAATSLPTRTYPVALAGGAAYAVVVVVQWLTARRPSIPRPADSPATADPTGERR